MRMVAQPANYGARGVDCVSVITPAVAQWLVDNGFEYVSRYLGSLTTAEIAVILGHGLALFPVCYGGDHSVGVDAGDKAVAYLHMLGMPAGVTVWADIEGITGLDAPTLIKRIDAFAVKLRAGKYDPGGYFANDTLLTSIELGSLLIDRYWQGASKIVDRFGHLAEPTLATGPIGWCGKQIVPGNITKWRGKPTPIQIDVDFVYEDFRTRVPTWCVGIP